MQVVLAEWRPGRTEKSKGRQFVLSSRMSEQARAVKAGAWRGSTAGGSFDGPGRMHLERGQVRREPSYESCRSSS